MTNEKDLKKPANNSKTYEYVFNYFSNKILSGELKINDKILPEREISEKLNVSRNSIREVMHMLEINGLIECIQGSGNYVRCNPEEYMMKSVHMVMSLMNVKHEEIYHLRKGYELVGLQLAMEMGTQEEIDEIHQALINMENSTEEKECSYWDHEFHKRILNASHNRMLILYASMIDDLLNQFVSDFRERINANEESAAELSRVHWNMYDALITKNILSGSLALNRHFEMIAEHMS